MFDLEALIAAWKNVEIARRFMKLVASAWSGLRQNRGAELADLGELKEKFFAETVGYGDRVVLRGRLSQYCPIYLPFAYVNNLQTAQQFVELVDGKEYPGTRFGTRPNPLVTALNVSAKAGGVLAFLFDVEATGTPKLISMYHRDRTEGGDLRGNDPGVPVILDIESAKYLNRVVEVSAVISRLDERLCEAIRGSEASVVQGYYHAFYQPKVFPNQGYVLDARIGAEGKVAPTSIIAPFFTSLGLELSYTGSLGHEECVLSVRMRRPAGRRRWSAGPIVFSGVEQLSGGHSGGDGVRWSL